MLWEEDDNSHDQGVPDDVVDLAFNIECRELPVDHAYALAQALYAALPWLVDEMRVGIHSIHLAGAQNGWERPDPELGQKLILSRRTKLTLRVPSDLRERVSTQLQDVTLDVAGHPLVVRQPRIKALSHQGTIFARQIALEPGEEKDEDAFLMRMVNELKQHEIRVKKALCGKTLHLATPAGPLPTRSLMLADLTTEHSLRLQERGFGSHRHLGCGIFLAHKGIDAVKKAEDE